MFTGPQLAGDEQSSRPFFLVRLGVGGGAGLRLVNLVADRGCLRSSRPGFTEGDNRPPLTLGPQAHLNQSSPRPPLHTCQGEGTAVLLQGTGPRD